MTLQARTLGQGLAVSAIGLGCTTHAISGLGTTELDYAASCRGATVGDGLAVRGEEVLVGGPAVDSWLRQIGLTTDTGEEQPSSASGSPSSVTRTGRP